ncbi:baseplate assembly protein [Erwinia endophytica]|uniref:GPW/gp25 family protein n=1 Tax=Erwinia endophytica TaxID=1563158 RepID=UPI001265FEE0|nr:GPW/gp25 family protein [Erwinia endophytica]KAB8307268.1 baseplate assembly protein [Erwinia endophytica]
MNGTDRKTGQRLSGRAHLRQSVVDILTTPVGSRVMLRDYGSDLPDLVDRPQDGLTKLKIIAATASALAKWEPRLTVNTVNVARDGDGVFVLSIEGVSSEGNEVVTIDGVKI